MEELNSHKGKGTWKVVPLQGGIKPVTSRWVPTDKYGPDGEVTRRKARLVARGFQQGEGIDYEETFASVVKSASTRILLALAAICQWHVHQGDVKTAFLNSDLDKPVYMKAPMDVQLPRGHCLTAYQSPLRIEAVSSRVVPKAPGHSFLVGTGACQPTTHAFSSTTGMDSYSKYTWTTST